MSLLRYVGITARKVTHNVYLYEQTTAVDHPRPLVIVLGWLLGKKEHVKKYTDIYLAEGCDVVQIQARLKHLTTPKVGQIMNRNVLELCYDNRHASQPIFVHGFSAGIIIYGDLLHQTAQNREKYGNFKDRLKGQILDSYVAITSFPDAASKASSNNAFFKAMVKSSFDFYLNLSTQNMGIFQRATETLKKNEYRTPTKIIYSLTDPLVDPNLFEGMLTGWVKRGVKAECQTYDDALHCAILKKFPEHYMSSCIEFLRRHVCTRNSLEEVKRNVACIHSTYM